MKNTIVLSTCNTIKTAYFAFCISAFFTCLAFLTLISPSQAQYVRSELLSVQDSLTLITLAQPRIAKKARISWANSLIWGMEQHRIKRNKENVCAMVAIIDQESNFKANPHVAGLGKKVIKTVHAKLDRVPFLGYYGKKFLHAFPNEKKSYYAMLRNARTERDLDWTYRKLLHNSLGTMKSFSVLTHLLEHNNEIDTIGSMQVSVSFAIKQEEKRHNRTLTLKEIEIVRDWMYTKRGGIFYGAKLLLNYRTDYRKKIFRFADYNAGRYASRNAAFQYMINQILRSRLVLDGDLLRYNSSGSVSWQLSNSETALQSIIKKYNLTRLSPLRLRADLLKEKRYRFSRTKTYRIITRLYQRLKRRPILRAKLPEIHLKSEKFTRRFTTKRFAQKVNGRYQTCIKRVRTALYNKPLTRQRLPRLSRLKRGRSYRKKTRYRRRRIVTARR